jgi:hypothetical protein
MACEQESDFTNIFEHAWIRDCLTNSIEFV